MTKKKKNPQNEELKAHPKPRKKQTTTFAQNTKQRTRKSPFVICRSTALSRCEKEI